MLLIIDATLTLYKGLINMYNRLISVYSNAEDKELFSWPSDIPIPRYNELIIHNNITYKVVKVSHYNHSYSKYRIRIYVMVISR